MIEPVTTFRDPQGAPLRRWAVKAGMLITETTYDAASGCLDVVVEEPKPAKRAEALPLSVVNTERGRRDA